MFLRKLPLLCLLLTACVAHAKPAALSGSTGPQRTQSSRTVRRKQTKKELKLESHFTRNVVGGLAILAVVATAYYSMSTTDA